MTKQFELKSDENKTVGTLLVVDKDFDKNCFIYFNTDHLTIRIQFSYKCNKCGKNLKHDCVGLIRLITTFTCECGEFEGEVARKGYSVPHSELNYTQYSKEKLEEQREHEINIIKEKYNEILKRNKQLLQS